MEVQESKKMPPLPSHSLFEKKHICHIVFLLPTLERMEKGIRIWPNFHFYLKVTNIFCFFLSDVDEPRGA